MLHKKLLNYNLFFRILLKINYNFIYMDTSDEGEVVSDTESEIEEGEIVPGNQAQMVENEYNLEFFETKSERGSSLLTRGGF